MTAVLTPMNALRNNMFGLDDSSSLEFPSSTNNNVDWRAKYLEVADVLSETRNELDEFQTSSKELEEELERELERTEKAQQDLKNKVVRLENERDEWKTKFMSLQTTHNTTTTSLQRELDMIRQEAQRIKIQLRDLEMGNDDLERNERAISTSLADVEAKYSRALEEKILLEHELLDKANLEEEHQRMKDELRDANEEIAILRKQAAPSRASMLTDVSTSSSAQNSSNLPRASFDEPPSTPVGDLQLSDLVANSTSPKKPTLQPRSSPEGPSRLARSVVKRTGLSSSRVPSVGPAPLTRSTTTPTALGRTVRGSPHPRLGLRTTTSSQSPPPLPPLPALDTMLQSVTPTSTHSGLPIPRSKAAQKVTDWRNRFSTLEQKIHTRVPRLPTLRTAIGRAAVNNSAATTPILTTPVLPPLVLNSPNSSPHSASGVSRTTSLSMRAGSLDLSPRKRTVTGGLTEDKRRSALGDTSWVLVSEDGSPSPLRDRERLRANQRAAERAQSPTEHRTPVPLRMSTSVSAATGRSMLARSAMGGSPSLAAMMSTPTARRPLSNISSTTTGVTERSTSMSTSASTLSTPLSSRPTTPTTPTFLPISSSSTVIGRPDLLARSTTGPSAFQNAVKRSSFGSNTALQASGLRPPSGEYYKGSGDVLTTDDLGPLPPPVASLSTHSRAQLGNSPRPPPIKGELKTSRIGRVKPSTRKLTDGAVDLAASAPVGGKRYRTTSTTGGAKR